MKKIVLLPLALLSISLVVGIARAETFTVSPHQEITRPIGLSNGDRVSGSISVVGGSGNDIDFYVTDPNGNIILRYDRVTQTSFSFSASTTGTYTMRFDNSFSIFSTKSVTLDYTVTESILGLPQEYFLVLLGLIVVLIVVVVVILRKTKEMKTSSEAKAPTKLAFHRFLSLCLYSELH